MLEMKITITAADLAEAINNLASALNGGHKMPAPKEAAPVVSAPAADSATPAAPVNPAPAPTPVPTAAPQYTLDMLAAAGSALIDAGKMDQLIQLLTKFGVASLTELAPDHYGAVATELRALGAAI